MTDQPKYKVVLLQVIIPDEIESTALLSVFNQALQAFTRKEVPEYGPLDYHVCIIGKHGLRREPVT